MSRTWEVLKAAWAEEKAAPDKPKLNRNEREFQAAAIEILETPASPAGRAVAYVILAVFVLGIAWASIGKMDVHATMQGRIVPVGNVKVIEPLEASTVRDIHVKAGDVVQKGDLLIELDPTEQAADRDRIAQDLMMARVEAARLRTALDAFAEEAPVEELVVTLPEQVDPVIRALQTEVLRNDIAAHRATIESLYGQIATQTAQIKRIDASVAERKSLVSVLQERAGMLETLVQRRAGSRARYLEVAQVLYEERAIMASEEGQLGQIRAEIETLALRVTELKAEFRSTKIGELAEVERRIAGLRQELIKATRREERSRLIAPVTGTVQQLAVHTVGDVVTTGEQLMIVVPADAALEVEAMLLNLDKGFVEAGQSAEIKVEAFPFTKYGTIDGDIARVSNDAVDQEGQGLVFPTRVRMARSTIRVDGEDQALTPGMAVTVEVKTGKRRVIEFLLTPLLRYRDEAIRER